MPLDSLRHDLSQFLGIGLPPRTVAWSEQGRVIRDGYEELRITFDADGSEPIPAFLLLPAHPRASVLLQHQHAG